MIHTNKDGMIKGHIPTEAWRPSHDEFDYPKEIKEFFEEAKQEDKDRII